MQKLRTEDTGKIFEMALCLAFNTPFVGPYKYSLTDALKLLPRLTILTTLLPPMTHTAHHGSRFDFTSHDSLFHLSAKTTKKYAKIAPQIIGQSQPLKFCKLIGIPFHNIYDLKIHIQIHIKHILHIMISFTFDSTNIFYNSHLHTIQLIKLIIPLLWDDHVFRWTRDFTLWNNSSTLKIFHNQRFVPLAEFQFHSKRRHNMAIRWHYNNLLSIFPTHFNITSL